MYRLPIILYAIHSNKVTHAACQYEAVENFVGTEIFMQTVKYRKFAGINNAADGINNAAGKKPAKGILV